MGSRFLHKLEPTGIAEMEIDGNKSGCSIRLGVEWDGTDSLEYLVH